MKRKNYVVFLFAAVFFTIAVFGFAHFEDRDYDASQKLELTGKVDFRAPGGFFLDSDSGKEYKMIVGPMWHLENLGLELKSGDKVSVTGYEDGEGVLVVTTLKKGLKTYEVYDPQRMFTEDFPRYGRRGRMHRNSDYYNDDEYDNYRGYDDGYRGRGMWHRRRGGFGRGSGRGCW
jgi:hypothetical protein